MKDVSSLPVRTIFVAEKEGKIEVRITNLILLRLLMLVWLLALFVLPLFDIWLRNTNCTHKKISFAIAAYAISLLLLGFIFIGILRAFQAIIFLDDVSLLLEKPAVKRWELSDLQNISCKENSVVIETSQKEEEIIGKSMGYSKKKLLLLVNYLNGEIKKRGYVSMQ